jgi:uncharacterized membrane protein
MRSEYKENAMVNTPQGFFSALYDLSFRSFITPKIVGIVYVLSLIVTALWAILYLIAGFAYAPYVGQSGGEILFHIVGAVLIFLVGSIGARIYLEFVLVVFRIAENTESLRDAHPSVATISPGPAE